VPGRKAILLVIFATAGLIGRAPADDLPRDTLATMYRAELGSRFDPGDMPRLVAAHELLEKYFAAASAVDRKEIAGRIDAMGLDRSIIGRLARLRMGWTALAPGVYYLNEKAGPLEVRYFLGIPKSYDLTRSWPLVVKLPVANAFLTHPPPDAQQVAQIYSQWITDELSAHPDAIVLMPLLNLDELYGPGPVGMNLVMQPIFDAAARANIDPARVYLIGHSMAAHAVWNLAIHYPTYFAAINPMAGSMHDSWQRFRLGNLQNILCVVWHDASDDVVKVVESREIVRYLRNLQYDVDYTETQTVGHAPPPGIAEEQYQKLRGRERNLYPRQVFIQSNSAETIYNRADWVQIYQPMSPGEQAKVEFSRGSQGMYLYQNGFCAAGEVTDSHTIHLSTKNVRVLRLYLNDQMVNLDQPLKVIVNGASRFEGLVPQSTEEMLKDQLFLGRGWRYYTAVLDLDLTESPATAPSTQPAQHKPIEYVTPEGEHKVFIPKGQ
jgi:hypothetical protein